MLRATAVAALIAGTDALTLGTAPTRQGRNTVVMKVERVAGEGDPFAGGIRKPVDGPRPDQGVTRWHADTGYIDDEDEPWHSTSRPRGRIMTKGILQDGFNSALPFFAAEDALMEALRQVKEVEDVDAAVAAALEAGARPGCPAIETAEKMLAAAKKEGATLKPAAPAKSSPQGKGWEGMERAVGK
eukprot:3294965-Prymnesium_polylepis.1